MLETFTLRLVRALRQIGPGWLGIALALADDLLAMSPPADLPVDAEPSIDAVEPPHRRSGQPPRRPLVDSREP